MFKINFPKFSTLHVSLIKLELTSSCARSCAINQALVQDFDNKSFSQNGKLQLRHFRHSVVWIRKILFQSNIRYSKLRKAHSNSKPGMYRWLFIFLVIFEMVWKTTRRKWKRFRCKSVDGVARFWNWPNQEKTKEKINLFTKVAFDVIPRLDFPLMRRLRFANVSIRVENRGENRSWQIPTGEQASVEQLPARKPRY